MIRLTLYTYSVVPGRRRECLMFLLRRGSAPSRPQDRPDVGFGGRGGGEVGEAEVFYRELVDFDAVGGRCTSFSHTILCNLMIASNTVVTALCY